LEGQQGEASQASPHMWAATNRATKQR